MLRYIIIKSRARWMSILLRTNPAWAYCVGGLPPLSKYVVQYWARMASRGFLKPLAVIEEAYSGGISC